MESGKWMVELVEELRGMRKEVKGLKKELRRWRREDKGEAVARWNKRRGSEKGELEEKIEESGEQDRREGPGEKGGRGEKAGLSEKEEEKKRGGKVSGRCGKDEVCTGKEGGVGELEEKEKGISKQEMEDRGEEPGKREEGRGRKAEAREGKGEVKTGGRESRRCEEGGERSRRGGVGERGEGVRGISLKRTEGSMERGCRSGREEDTGLMEGARIGRAVMSGERRGRREGEEDVKGKCRIDEKRVERKEAKGEVKEMGKEECKGWDEDESEDSEEGWRLVKEKGEKEDRVRKDRRRKNMVWRGVSGEDAEERARLATGVMEETLDRRVKVAGIIEREGEGKRKVLLIELEEEEDREELLERKGEIRRKWGIGVDEDLSMEERKLRWRMVEKAREERRKGRSTWVENRRLWIDGKEWKWDEVRRIWWEKKARQ